MYYHFLLLSHFKRQNKMNTKKRYRLLKDLPITLAGTVFVQKEFNSSVYKPENGGWLEEVPEELVMGCPEWFTPITIEEEVREKVLFTEDEIKKLIRAIRDGAMGYDTRSFLNGRLNEMVAAKKSVPPTPSEDKGVESRIPVLITEDGVSKYKGDNVYFADTKGNEASCWYELPRSLNKVQFDISGYKYFNTLEGAKAYLQKPKSPTKEQIIEAINNLY